MDSYQVITDRILAQLEQGTVPWRAPWTRDGVADVPRNLSSLKPYRGINAFLLACLGYERPFYLTLKQANDLGGRIRQGAHGYPVVFWKDLDVEEVDEGTGESRVKRIPMLKLYTVFNVAQTEGLESVKAILAKPTEHAHPVDPIPACQAIVDGMPKAPRILHQAPSFGYACYSVRQDTIEIPARDMFRDGPSYYATLFHEMAHATGHPTRLNRLEEGALIAPFGTADYSKEELTAEMGSAFLCAHAGIAPATVDNAASYIAGWLKKLRDDKRFVIQAAGKAQKAADYIFRHDGAGAPDGAGGR